MPSEDSIYIRTLKWASARGTAGFLLDELKIAVAHNEEEWIWIRRMFLGEINGEPVLIAHNGTSSNGGHYRYFLSASGAAAAIDYTELKEARASGKLATKLSIAAILIGVVVGIAQIYFQVVPSTQITTVSEQVPAETKG